VVIVEVEMFEIVCDISDCGVHSSADGRSVWLTAEQAARDVSARDRFIGFSEDENGKHYCSVHSGFCEVCDDRKPLHTLIQDEEEGTMQCRWHLTGQKPNSQAEDTVLGMRALVRKRAREQEERRQDEPVSD
jgi:hypothetical protein